ncbi:hypothetical protein PGIGA_G00162770 [Pangasianodon gigas]|uniref:Uncharacterized protein n=1 Tax=Pangasianodon gigas TaxID=30993 RepID=A0ACC5XTG0_PANGG|nr:hypothetical protein [Pangasianodon gigas]
MTVAYKYMDVAKLFLVNVLNMEMTYSTTSCIHTSYNNEMNIIIRKISVTLNKTSLWPSGSSVLWKPGLVFWAFLFFFFSVPDLDELFCTDFCYLHVLQLVLLCFRFSAFYNFMLGIGQFVTSYDISVMVVGFRGEGCYGGRKQHFSLRIFVEFFFCLGLFISACCVICCGNH